MNNKQIECFLAVARLKSFTKAGNELFFSQQTVSKYIAALEEDLGVRLLARDAKTVALTEAGAYYSSLFRSNVTHIEAVARETERYYAFLRSTLRIGLSEYLDPFGRILDAVQTYRALHPEITVHLRKLSNEQLLQTLLEDATSVALFSDAHVPVQSDIESTPVAKECLCIFGPADVIGADLPPEQREKRAELPYLQVQGWTRSFTENKYLLKAEAANLGLSPANVRMMPNLDSILSQFRFSRCVTVSDRNFGFINALPGLGHEELGEETHLYACRYTFSESPLAEDFIRFLQTCGEFAPYR